MPIKEPPEFTDEQMSGFAHNPHAYTQVSKPVYNDPDPSFYDAGLGTRRRNPLREFRWDRQGIHLAMGLPVGLSFLLCQLLGNDWAIPIAIAQAVVMVGFLAYEITEGWRIKDQAYVDIGGYLGGYMGGLGIALTALALLI